MNKMIAMSVAMIISGTALAEPVVISTGVPGGSYVGVYGANLSKLLAAKKIENKLVNSAGSMENLKRLESNEAQIAPATLDAYALYLKKGGTPLNILATLKSECGYLVVNKNGKVKNEDDLQTVKGDKSAGLVFYVHRSRFSADFQFGFHGKVPFKTERKRSILQQPVLQCWKALTGWMLCSGLVDDFPQLHECNYND
jgi:hypothetical protein